MDQDLINAVFAELPDWMEQDAIVSPMPTGGDDGRRSMSVIWIAEDGSYRVVICWPGSITVQYGKVVRQESD